MSAEPFGEMLRRSFAVLEREAPAHLTALGVALGAAAVDFSVDGDRVRVAVGAGARPAVGIPGDSPPAVRVFSSRAAILGLIDGQHTLAGAVREGVLDLFGRPDEIARFLDALVIYLHGAVRCPGMPAILARWRDLGGPHV